MLSKTEHVRLGRTQRAAPYMTQPASQTDAAEEEISIIIDGVRYVIRQLHPNELIITPFNTSAIRVFVDAGYCDLTTQWLTSSGSGPMGTLEFGRAPSPNNLILDQGRSGVVSWERTRRDIEKLGALPSDWATTGGGAITKDTIATALRLVDILSAMPGESQWAEPTSDGTIVLQVTSDAYTLTFEIDDSDSVGVGIKTLSDRPVYRDVPIDTVADFLESVVHGTGSTVQ